MPAAPNTVEFAEIIRAQKERVLELLRKGSREILGTEIAQVALDNKMSALVDVIVMALGGAEQSKEAAEAEYARATDHGLKRAEQGFGISQVSREFQVLRQAISKACVEKGAPLTEEARNIVVKVIDSAAALGVEWCSRKREEMIKESSAREIAFAVHDFRAPLGAIALATAEIADAIPLEARVPEIMEPLAVLQDNVERLSVEMEMTMREFASVFSGAEKLQIIPVRLSDAVTDVFDGFKLQARARNLTLSNQINRDVEAAAAPNALHRILANLVGNALRYTRFGGVTVCSSQRETDIEILVEDTGLGIINEKLRQIFERGMKEPGSPGMGFGLAIAKYLVEAQGGRIKVESTIGTGTTMRFTLPKAVPSAS